MSDGLNRILRLRPGELGLVLVMGFLLMGNSLALQVSGIVAISGFLSAGGVNQILLVLLIDYTLVLLASGLQTLIVDKFDRVRLIGGISFGFALAFLALRLMFTLGAPAWLNYSVMYLISEQQFILFPLVFWVLANDVFSMAQAKRLFPLISSWSFVGKLVGIGIAAMSPSFFRRAGINSEEILVFNALIYLLLYVLVVLGLRTVKIREVVHYQETLRETLSEGWNFVRHVDSFRYLMLSLLALALSVTIIEFRFLVVTDAEFGDQSSYQRFYSLYRLAATLSSFAIQMFLTSRIIKWLNLKNVFFIFPIVVLGGAVGMMVAPGISVAVAALLLAKLTRDTVYESAQKSFQALVPEERRGRVSTFMDSYLPALGVIAACLISGAIVLVGLWGEQDLHLVYLSVAAVAGALALGATFKMRAAYDNSLLNWRLKRRRRGASVLDKLDF